MVSKEFWKKYRLTSEDNGRKNAQNDKAVIKKIKIKLPELSRFIYTYTYLYIYIYIYMISIYMHISDGSYILY